jgi:hypothetical protein
MSKMELIVPVRAAFDAYNDWSGAYIKGGDYGVTQLLDPPRVVHLRLRHEHELPPESIKDKWKAFQGNAWHAFFEKQLRKANNMPEYKDRFPNRDSDRADAIAFFMMLANADIPKICIENPIGIMSTYWRRPDQVIQPFFFGNEARKGTCLWLKDLPKLVHIKENDLFEGKTHVSQGEIITYKSGKTCAKWYADAVKLSSKERSTARSVTFPGIAQAMADQWG